MVASDGSRPDLRIRQASETRAEPPLRNRPAERCEARRVRRLRGDRRPGDLAVQRFRRPRRRGRDPAQECRGERRRSCCRRGSACGRRARPGPWPTGPHAQPVARDGDLDRAVRVGPVRAPCNLVEPFQGRRRRVAVGITRPRRHDGDARPGGLEELAGRCGARPVVRDLEQVHRRQPSREQLRVHPLLDVPGKQESAARHLAEEHDRDIVDARAGVARLLGNAVGVRPEHAKSDRVERQLVAG